MVRGQAAGAVPPLATRNETLRALPPLASNDTTAAPAIALAAMPIMLANAPTMAAAPLDDDRAWWQRWPMIVMALAAIAIVVAIVMMFWPQQSPATKNATPTLAPSRMDTNPMPEQPLPAPNPAPIAPPNGTPNDPWGGGGQVVPAVPADPTAPDPNAPSPGQNPRDQFVGRLAGMVCKKISVCSDLDPTAASLVCDSMVSVLSSAATPGCPLDPVIAATCLQAINRIGCDQPLDASTAALLLNDFPSCIAALRC